MKWAGFYMTVLFLMASSFTGCAKYGEDLSATFDAKLVASFCAFHIVKIEDPAFYRLGMNWTSSTGQKYEHVFTVINHCDFPASRIKAGDRFRCKVVEKGANDQCAVCMGYMETPPLGHVIKVE